MRLLRVGFFALILASLSLPRVVAAAVRRVAVVEASTSRVPRGEVARLRGDVEDVLRSLGAEPVPFAETQAAAGGDCNESDCVMAIQRATGATHVLRVESVFKKGAFTIQLRLWEGRTGKTLSSDGKSCDICTLPDLHAALRDRVGALCTRVFEAEAATETPPLTPTPLPPAPAPPPSPVVEVSPPAAATAVAPSVSAGTRVAQVGGVALMALGAAAAAYGGYLLHLNGKVACENGERQPCAQHHVTAGRGAGFLVGGLGALFAGGILFYSFTW